MSTSDTAPSTLQQQPAPQQQPPAQQQQPQPSSFPTFEQCIAGFHEPFLVKHFRNHLVALVYQDFLATGRSSHGSKEYCLAKYTEYVDVICHERSAQGTKLATVGYAQFWQQYVAPRLGRFVNFSRGALMCTVKPARDRDFMPISGKAVWEHCKRSEQVIDEYTKIWNTYVNPDFTLPANVTHEMVLEQVREKLFASKDRESVNLTSQYWPEYWLAFVYNGPYGKAKYASTEIAPELVFKPLPGASVAPATEHGTRSIVAAPKPEFRPPQSAAAATTTTTTSAATSPAATPHVMTSPVPPPPPPPPPPKAVEEDIGLTDRDRLAFYEVQIKVKHELNNGIIKMVESAIPDAVKLRLLDSFELNLTEITRFTKMAEAVINKPTVAVSAPVVAAASVPPPATAPVFVQQQPKPRGRPSSAGTTPAAAAAATHTTPGAYKRVRRSGVQIIEDLTEEIIRLTQEHEEGVTVFQQQQATPTTPRFEIDRQSEKLDKLLKALELRVAEREARVQKLASKGLVREHTAASTSAQHVPLLNMDPNQHSAAAAAAAESSSPLHTDDE